VQQLYDIYSQSSGIVIIAVTCLTTVDPRESCQSNPSWHEDSQSYPKQWQSSPLHENNDSYTDEDDAQINNNTINCWQYFPSETTDRSGRLVVYYFVISIFLKV